MFLKKTLHNPAKNPRPQSLEARRTPHGDLHPATRRSPPCRLPVRPPARVHGRTNPWAPAAAPAAGQLVHAGGCGGGGAFAQRVRSDPASTTDTARAFAPQGRSMAAGAEGDCQVWACITTVRAEVRTEL